MPPDGGYGYCISALACEGLRTIVINNPPGLSVGWFINMDGEQEEGTSWFHADGGNGFGRNGAENRWAPPAVLTESAQYSN